MKTDDLGRGNELMQKHFESICAGKSSGEV